MADLIQLRGIRAVGTHGVLPEERERAQPFEVDLDVAADLKAAGASDRLEDTVDYGELATRVAAIVQGTSCLLLEALAERIANLALEDGRVSSVTVTVRKLRPPVPVDMASAGVRVVRP